MAARAMTARERLREIRKIMEECERRYARALLGLEPAPRISPTDAEVRRIYELTTEAKK